MRPTTVFEVGYWNPMDWLYKKIRVERDGFAPRAHVPLSEEWACKNILQIKEILREISDDPRDQEGGGKLILNKDIYSGDD